MERWLIATCMYLSQKAQIASAAEELRLLTASNCKNWTFGNDKFVNLHFLQLILKSMRSFRIETVSRHQTFILPYHIGHQTMATVWTGAMKIATVEDLLLWATNATLRVITVGMTLNGSATLLCS